MDKREENGYLTVEATLVMPMIVVGLLFTMFSGFYLYNVCILRQVAYTAALRGSLVKEGSSIQIEEYTRQELEKLIEGRLIAEDKAEFQIDVTAAKVRVEVSIQMSSPLLQKIFSAAGLWRFEAKTEAARRDMVSFIRGIRMMAGEK